MKCHYCGEPLSEIKKAYWEYEVLVNNVFRPKNCIEGIAGEVKLYCANCDVELNRNERVFYYERWFKTKQMRLKTSPQNV